MRLPHRCLVALARPRPLPRSLPMDPASSPAVVFGGGSFGTAMAVLLARHGYPTCMLVRRQEVADGINRSHRNPTYFSNVELPCNLTATLDPAEALRGVKLIVHSVPMQASSDFLKGLAPLIPEDTLIVSTSKGLHTQTLQMMSEVIPAALDRPDQPTAFLSGPSLAKEIIEGMPTGFTVASAHAKNSEIVRQMFSGPRIRVYPTADVIGVELMGALKNVFAIGAGIVEGLGYGANTTAMLVTLACQEMNRLAQAMGAHPATIRGLCGIGDLMLTCYGSLSRNRTVGTRLGRGETLASIVASMSEVAEGVATTPAARALARKYDVYTPVIDGVDDILQGKHTVREAVDHLMSLPITTD